MTVISVFLEIFRRPTVVEMLGELVVFVTPLWIAVLVGVLVGWVWRPKWANLVAREISGWSVSKQEAASSSSSPPCFASIPSFNSLKLQLPWISDEKVQQEAEAPGNSSDCSSSQLESDSSARLSDADLKHIFQLVEETDGGPAWIKMMDRSTPTMGYQAWRRDPEKGPPQYRSRTVFEDADPETVRDFFWDDEFRMKWDDMLLQASTLEECRATGSLVVQWVRKFPFFCSDREYLIGRRIWQSGRSYYCVTKGVPYPSVPRRTKPRRVDLYYSSWCVRAVESRRGDGQLTSCEVILFHHEDMGIPWEIAKLGVKQGMWGAVRKIDPGLRKYQKERAAGVLPSSCAQMAQINTKVSMDYLNSMENNTNDSSEIENPSSSSEKPEGRNVSKLLVVGGAVLLACSLDRGLLTKAVIFGVARRFAKFGGGRQL